jgi:hypothetical protein
MLKSGDTHVESAWCQRQKLKHDTLLSSFASNFSSGHYHAVRTALVERGGARRAEAAVAGLRAGSVVVELVAHVLVYPRAGPGRRCPPYHPARFGP